MPLVNSWEMVKGVKTFFPKPHKVWIEAIETPKFLRSSEPAVGGLTGEIIKDLFEDELVNSARIGEELSPNDPRFQQIGSK